MDPEFQDEASTALVPVQENPPAPDPVNPDPTRDLIYQMLDRMNQQQVARDVHNAVEPRPDFLQLVMMVKNMGTKPYSGGTNPFAADAWLHNLERNFAATRCPEDFKTDVAIHYLEEEAISWWISVEPKYGILKPTWIEFKSEFERKYFPSEARDRLEVQFLELKQGNRKVRDYEAEFTKLRRHVRYRQGDEQAIIRRFLRGLRPELRSRLQVVEFTSLSHLMKRAVNVEEGINDEQEELQQLKTAKIGEGNKGVQPVP